MKTVLSMTVIGFTERLRADLQPLQPLNDPEEIRSAAHSSLKLFRFQWKAKF